MVLEISVYANGDVHVADNDNAAVVRTSEVGVTVVKGLWEIRNFLLLKETNLCLLISLFHRAF